jgi:UDP-glucuronate decarboxylase
MEFTILELASQVVEMTGSRSKIVHRPKPQDDPRQRRPDISKAQELLKWSPHTSLQEGLKMTIAYFEEMLKADGMRALLVNTAPRAGAPANS